MAFDKNIDNIIFLDCKENSLRIGSPVRYTGTGTTGFVTDLMIEECEMWAQLDTTGLNYHTSTLVLIEPEGVKIIFTDFTDCELYPQPLLQLLHYPFHL